MLKVLHLRVPLAKALQARALHLRVLQAVLNLGPLVVDQVLLLGKAELLHLLEGLNQGILAVEVKIHLIHLIHPLAAVQALADLNLEASQIPRIKVQAAIAVAAVQRKSLPMIAVQAQGEALTDPSSLIHFIGAGPITEEEVDFLLELC